MESQDRIHPLHEDILSAGDQLDQLDQVPATDLVYYIAYRNCQLITIILCSYTLITLAVIPVILFLSTWSKLSLYLIYLFLVTSLRCYLYISMRNALKKQRTYFQMASKTNHKVHIRATLLSEHIRGRSPLYLDEYDLASPADPDN